MIRTLSMGTLFLGLFSSLVAGQAMNFGACCGNAPDLSVAAPMGTGAGAPINLTCTNVETGSVATLIITDRGFAHPSQMQGMVVGNLGTILLNLTGVVNTDYTAVGDANEVATWNLPLAMTNPAGVDGLLAQACFLREGSLKLSNVVGIILMGF